MKETIICEYLRKNFFNYSHILISTCLFLTVQSFSYAQPNTYIKAANNIQTIVLRTSSDSLAYPAIALGADENLIVSFDEMEHDMRTLHYSFQHCNANWLQSDLMDIEFFDGINKVYDHDEAQLSFNTTTDYIHYQIIAPTIDLKISGNYYIIISDENDTELLRLPFIIYESLTGIQSRITRQKQQQTATQTISLCILHPMLRTANAATEIKIGIWQNNYPWTFRTIDNPTFVRPNELVFDNAATFEAGNEHRWADNRSLRYNGLNVRAIDFFDPFYHITLTTDALPTSYYFHEDFNGMQYIEARDIHYPAHYAADYNFVHFSFYSQNIGNVYLFGELTEMQPQPMLYDAARQIYYANILLKQGLHSYTYVQAPNPHCLTATFTDNATAPSVDLTEGSFPETENDYYIVVYYRQMGDTVDRVVGYKKHNSKKTLNDFIR